MNDLTIYQRENGKRLNKRKHPTHDISRIGFFIQYNVKSEV